MPAQKIIGEVKKFLACFSTINIHHFSNSLLYLPFYLVLKELGYDLATGKNRDSENKSCLVFGEEKFSDKLTNVDVKSNDSDFFCNALNIGLSDITIRKGATTFISKHFIERLPFWGIAHTDNGKIDTLVKGRVVASSLKNTFSGKLSLLNYDDFTREVDGDLIGVGLYSEGSTVYKLFKKSFHGEDVPETFTFNSDKELMVALNGGLIDVCLTINPWILLGPETYLVYNHTDEPQMITHLYIKKSNNISYDRVQEKFIDYLLYLVQWKVAGMSKLCSRNEYGSYAEDYCTIYKNDARDECRACKDNSDCIVPWKAAIEILVDSRIYNHDTDYYDMKDKYHKKEFDNLIKNAEIDHYLSAGNGRTFKSISDCDFETHFPFHNKLYSNESEKKNFMDTIISLSDPLKKLSSLLVGTLSVCGHGSAEVFSYKDYEPSLDETHPKYLDSRIFAEVCRWCNIKLDRAFSAIYENMKIGGSHLSGQAGVILANETLLKNIFDCEIYNGDLKAKQWVRIFFPQRIFKETFALLTGFLKGEGNATEVKFEFEYRPSDIDNLLLMHVSYVATNYTKDKPVEKSKFITLNPIGGKILKGYHCYVKEDGEPTKFSELFNVGIEGKLSFGKVNGKCTPIMYERNETRTEVCSLDLSKNKTHHWFFIFNIECEEAYRQQKMER